MRHRVAAFGTPAREPACPALVRLGGDVRHGTLALGLVGDCVAGLCLVRQGDDMRREIVEQNIGSTAVGDVTADQQEAEPATCAVGERVELAVASTTADLDRWGGAPPFFRGPPSRGPSYACCRSELLRAFRPLPPACRISLARYFSSPTG